MVGQRAYYLISRGRRNDFGYPQTSEPGRVRWGLLVGVDCPRIDTNFHESEHRDGLRSLHPFSQKQSPRKEKRFPNRFHRGRPPLPSRSGRDSASPLPPLANRANVDFQPTSQWSFGFSGDWQCLKPDAARHRYASTLKEIRDMKKRALATSKEPLEGRAQ